MTPRSSSPRRRPQRTTIGPGVAASFGRRALVRARRDDRRRRRARTASSERRAIRPDRGAARLVDDQRAPRLAQRGESAPAQTVPVIARVLEVAYEPASVRRIDRRRGTPTR